MNVMTIVLIVTEAVIFPVQLYQWLNRKGGVYTSMQKSWKYLYYLVVANSFYRYLIYFGRYVIIRRPLF